MLNKTNILVIFILITIGCVNLPETTAENAQESLAATVDIDATVDAKVEAKIKGLTPVSEYYGSEVSLYYPGLYAGSTDLVCMHNGKETIADFKQANRAKREEWIEDYFLQIGAYAMAHDYIYGSNIEQGVIMVCTPDLYYQEFKFDGEKMKNYRHKFLKRLSQFYGQNVA